MQGRKLNVKLLDAAELPRYAHDGDAGFDLCITERGEDGFGSTGIE